MRRSSARRTNLFREGIHLGTPPTRSSCQAARRLALPITAEGETLVAEIIYGPQGPALSVEGVAPAPDAVAVADGNAVYVLRHGRQTKVTLRDAMLDEAGDQDKSGLVRAPMHGKVLSLLVEQGARVARGQRVAVIEAMKMEHTLVAPIDGMVTEIAVAPDAQVAEGGKVMVIDRDGKRVDRYAASSHQTVCRLRFGRRSRGLDQTKAERKKEARAKVRAHPYDAHGAQARRRN